MITLSLARYLPTDPSKSENINSAAEQIGGWLKEKLNGGEFSLSRLESLLQDFLGFCSVHKYVLKESFVHLLKTLGLVRSLLEGVTRDELIGIIAPKLFPAGFNVS